MLLPYITKKENTTFIIVLMLLNRVAFILNFHFHKYETDTCLLISWTILCIVSIADIFKWLYFKNQDLNNRGFNATLSYLAFMKFFRRVKKHFSVLAFILFFYNFII